jgi:diguanylate cyclase (GGDEF)-like protein
MKYSWLTGTVALLLVGFLTFYAIQLEQRLALRSAQLELGATLDKVEKEMITSLAVLEQMFLGFQQYLELTEQLPDPDEGALRRTMDTLVLNNSFMVSLVVTDGSGNILHWTNSGPRPNLSERDYFNVHSRSLIDGVYLSAPLPSIMSPGQWILGASKALRYPDESLSRVLVAIIDARRLFNVLDNAAAESAAVLTVLSPGGDVLARSPDHHQIVGSNQPDLLEGRRPTAAATTSATTRVIDGRKQLLMMRHLDTYGLVIRAEAPLGALIGQQPSRLLPLVGGGAVVALLLLWQLSSMLQLQRRAKDLEQQLRAETRRDPLTGLPVWPATRDGSCAEDDATPPLALLMIGLDGYSQLLAEQGEERGNLLVAQSARMVAQCLPATARLHRYLCSRFIVLLPEADQTRALAVAEQIRAAFAAETFDIHQIQINITASIGISPLTVDEADSTTAINRAATALTTATNRGGNQVCWLAARESWLEQRT